MLNTVFFGTPAAAVPFLERLARTSRVLGVVTSPDKPAGRGYQLTPTPVKAAARVLGLPVAQPERLKEFSLADFTGGAGADVGIVVAYGKLIPPSVFNTPRHGLVNVHFSLLPRYRGAGPVQWALINGDAETGVSLFRIEQGLDTGPVHLSRRVAVAPEDNTVSLRERLARAGLELQDELLRGLESGALAPVPQSGEATSAPLLKKEDGQIRWADTTAVQAANLVRGTYEWPGAFGRINGMTLKIRRGLALPGGGAEPPGRVLGVSKGRGLLIKCREGVLLAERVQPEGKKEMDAEQFWNGARLKAGDAFEVP